VIGPQQGAAAASAGAYISKPISPRREIRIADLHFERRMSIRRQPGTTRGEPP
jgi:hypothetical protein